MWTKFTNTLGIVTVIALPFVVACFTLSLRTQLQSANQSVRALQHELALRDKAIAQLGRLLPGELLGKFRVLA